MRTSITQITRIAVAIGAVALVAAGCGDDSEDEAPARAAQGSSAVVAVASVDGADVLTDAQGRTLYTTTAEEGGKVECVDACTSFWAPVTATAQQAEQAAEELDVDLAVIERPEGDRQLTFDGLPLYTFTEEDAGQLEGDGFEDDFQGNHFVWEAVRTDGGSAPSRDSDEPSSGGGIYDYDY